MVQRVLGIAADPWLRVSGDCDKGMTRSRWYLGIDSLGNGWNSVVAVSSRLMM